MTQNLTRFGGKLMTAPALSGLSVVAGGGDATWNFGWIPPDTVNARAADLYWLNQSPGAQVRRASVNTAHSNTIRGLPVFRIRGGWQMDKPRYTLWKAGPM